MASLSDQSSLVDVDPARRFGGTLRLYGQAGAQRLFASHVVVIGIGGVGSWTAEALARSGVGRITLVDLDHVAESNINRQIHACDATLGMPKVEAMRARILGFAPHCQVQAVEAFVDPTNWPSLVTQIESKALGPIAALVDACDQVSAKAVVIAWALAHQRAVITVGAAGGKTQAHWVQMQDLAEVTHDPLLSKLRYGLRRQQGLKRTGRMNVMCVFSQERVRPPQREALNDPTPCEVSNPPSRHRASDLNCHGYGSSVAVTATFGLCAAAFVQNHLQASDACTMRA